jgi:anti-sigma regulatory factor (Ser/Thr protein kinase)
VRLAISTLARSAGLEEERVEDLKMAVSEACANAVLAHEDASSNERVNVRWADAESSVTVEVEEHVPSVGDVEVTDDSLGLSARLAFSGALLESLVDECSIDRRGAEGTVTTLVVAR